MSPDDRLTGAQVAKLAGRGHPVAREAAMGIVYFVRNRTTNNVKIGWTKDIKGRLSSLQTGCDGELELMAAVHGAPKAAEGYLHRLFVADHVRGEWYGGVAITGFLNLLRSSDWSLEEALSIVLWAAKDPDAQIVLDVLDHAAEGGQVNEAMHKLVDRAGAIYGLAQQRVRRSMPPPPRSAP